MQFNDEHKKEMGNKYFPFGVHRVELVTFNLDKTADGKEFMDVFFTDPEDNEREDSVRLFFTTDKGSQYSFNTLRSIYVHNAPEPKKDAARQTFDKLGSTEEMLDLLNDRLGGGEAWFTKYLDPNRTYVGNDGITRQSTNKNIYGWEPELQAELLPKKQGDDLVNAVQQVFPGAEEVSPTESVDQAMEKWGNG